jgi:hypothetical protein
MSRVIGQDLQASGVAQVIVVLKRPPQVGGAAGGAGAAAGIVPRGPMLDVPMHGIERHFRTSELSQDSALAASSLTAATATEPTVSYYPNLGVAFGTVDRAGLAALRADPAVASVQGAPKLSLIAPERIADAKLTVNRTWGLTALKAPDLWAKGFTGAGVLVGHLDTGSTASTRRSRTRSATTPSSTCWARRSPRRRPRATAASTGRTPPRRSPAGRSRAAASAWRPMRSWRRRWSSKAATPSRACSAGWTGRLGSGSA